MNKFELKKIIEEMQLAYPNMIKKIDDETYKIEDLIIEHIFDYYTKIKGKIPLAVAAYIYNTYPTERKYIRVHGNITEDHPSIHSIDDQYLKEIEINFKLNFDEYQKQRELAKNRMLLREIDNKYICSYHVDNKDDLIIFLTELIKYYKEKYSLNIDIIDIETMINRINNNILKTINPSITMEEWINQPLSENRLRKQIKEFDITTNPFITKAKDNYLTDRMNTDYYNLAYSDDRTNCAKVEIIRDNDIKYGFERSKYGYMYYLKAFIDTSPLKIYHYYTNKDVNQLGTGEIIAIDRFGKNRLFNEEIDIYYNLDKNICGTKYGHKHKLLEKDKRFIENKLTEGIDLVKESKPYTLVKKK